ncbi:hypothetical protein CsatB_016995 [Cannabis sativa]
MAIMGMNYSLIYELPFLLLLVLLQVHTCMGSNTISAGQSLNWNQTIVSKNQVFEMGFFTPGNSRNYYIGIWYKKAGNQTIVWVGNRDKHVSNPSLSSLKLLENGNLTLVAGGSNVIWSSNSFSRLPNSTVGVLLDNGNFVIRDVSDSSIVIWQSFTHPTDTILPGMINGYNKIKNESIVYISVRGLDDPAPGNFSIEMDENPTSLLFKTNGSVSWSAYWIGSGFTTGYVDKKWTKFPYGLDTTYVENEKESYFTFAPTSPTALTRMTVEASGKLCQYIWRESSRNWTENWCILADGLREFNMLCGPFTVRDIYNTTLCVCLQGFEPKNTKAWELGDGLDGCVRRAPLQCNARDDTFVEVRNIVFLSQPEEIKVKNIEACRLACLSKCSCNAYYFDDSCFIWVDDLVNIVPSAPHEVGPYWHIRMGASHLSESKVANRKTTWIAISILLGWLFLTFLGIGLVFLGMRYFVDSLERVEDSLVLYRYKDLKLATKNFSQKLGEGGFGSVYKGVLANSTCIAVKKLTSMQQAEKQFRAELKTIGAIQHVNLVRLRGFCAESSRRCFRGFCAESSRRFLVYEYMPKGSLDSSLFGTSLTVLDWNARCRIAIGVAKGLCYLHEECRECIIHCDVKPENVLLDEDNNAKLADFGLAKLVGRDFSRVLTTMRGTRGYLAPEWISGLAITPKADVYSYGMLLFELISGKRNNTQLEQGMEHYFPFRVSKSLSHGEDVFPLLDCRIEGNAEREEVNRYCKVACWCIQEDEKSRPNMSQVVQILMGVKEIDLPPVPLFLERLAGVSMEAMHYYQVTTSGGTTQYYSFSS